MKTGRHWAVILAGGRGMRLQPLTRLVSGDNRPKQFCPLFDGRTLFTETRARVALSVPPARTLSVVTREHEAFYRLELAGLPRSLVVEQPANRGTTAAVSYGVARVKRLDAAGVVGFFPADHYFSDLAGFHHTIKRGYAAARAHPARIVLIGVTATCAEPEYGWIEPGHRLSRSGDVWSVAGFWEKPSAPTADALLARGCLWNTFICIGRVPAFAELLGATVPQVWSRAALLAEPLTHEAERAVAEFVYLDLPSSDLSSDVLARGGAHVSVLRAPAIGWTDLGQPARVRDVLSVRGLPALADEVSVA